MPAYKLEELKYPELDSLNRRRTLFVISVSPLEEHGPHLPIGVDLFNAEFFAAEITKKFLQKYPDWNVVTLPSFCVGSFAFDAPGTLIVRPRVVKNLLIDTLSSLARHGFEYFLISNAHGGPTHIVALEEAARRVSRKYQVRAVSLAGHLVWEFLRGKYWPEILKRMELSPEEEAALKEDSHAGQWETSMMLKLKPDLVDSSYQDLKPFTAKLYERLRRNYPLRNGEGLGYVGYPALASKRLAEASSEFLMERLFEMVEKSLLAPERLPPSMFYRVQFFKTNFLQGMLLLVVLGGLLLWLMLKR